MIALDTNVLVRFLVRDHDVQAEVARRLLEEELSEERPGYVSIAAVVELEWVLRSNYEFGRTAVATAILALLDVPNLQFESEAAVRRAADHSGGDFVDRLIHFVGAAVGCERTVTFDRRFAKLRNVELLQE